MSMISSLIDELNKSADEWNGSNMFELARMCREAADTITELRGALQVASVDYRHLQDENAKLREQMERLVTLLRVDCDIDASWDGLRRFWSIGLTEDGCLMRDRACKAEAENAKLRELLSVMAYCNQFRRDCDGCSMNGAAGIITERAGCDELLDRLRELGVDA